MNHHTVKCISCNTICHLPSLKARAVSCDACARKRSVALNEARDTTPAWARMDDLQRIPDGEIADDWHALNAQLPFGPVDKWEQRARELTEEKREVGNTAIAGCQSRLIRHAAFPPNVIAWYVQAGESLEVYVPRELDVNVHGSDAVPSTLPGFWTASGPGNVWLTRREEKPAKRPFAVGDRVVVKRVPFGYDYAFPSHVYATVDEVSAGDALPIYVQMETTGRLSGARDYAYGRGEGFVVAAEDLEHA